jgi:hypothetical protein
MQPSSVHVASVCMTIRVYSKTLVLERITGSARAGSQSTVRPKLTGRRRDGVTYRTHGHRWAARNTKRCCPRFERQCAYCFRGRLSISR